MTTLQENKARPKCTGVLKNYTQKIEAVYSHQWLRFNKYHWKRPDSEKTEICGAITRTTEKEGKVNGVGLIPLIKNHGEIDLLLIADYRPPTDRFMIEFPGGLLDKGEFPI